MTRLARVWPPLLLAALLLGIFAPCLWTGHVLAIGDGLAQDFPLRLLAASIWKSGRIPFWDPYDFGGLPLLAAIHVGVFYPGNLPFLLLRPIAAMNLAELIALWSGGVGAYALARAQPLGRLAAFASGLVFMLGGFLIAHIENLQMLQAAALMPWVLWAIARHHAAKDSRYALAFAGVLALQVLAGHPQVVVFTGLLAIPYSFVLLANRQPGTRWTFILPLGLAAMLGLALAALQLAPTLEFIPRTQRALIDYDTLTFRSLPPHQLVSFWFPFFFGGYGTWLSHVGYWGSPHPTELTGYVGLASVMLVLLAALAWKKRPVTLFWLAVAGVGLVLASGSFTPLYRLWAATPLLKSLPVPGRHLLETDLALAMLAGFGLEALGDAANARRAWAAWVLVGLPVLGVIALLAVGGAAIEAHYQIYMPPWITLKGALSLARPAIWLPPALWLALGVILWQKGRLGGASVAVTLLLALDLVLFVTNQHWAVGALTLPRPLVEPAPMLTEGRYWPVCIEWVYPYDDFARVRAMRYPNWGGLVGVRSIIGYDAFIPSRYARVMGVMESTGHLRDLPAVWSPGHHGLDLLGVKTLWADAESSQDSGLLQDLARRGWQPLTGNVVGRGFHNSQALPDAWRLARVTSAPADAVEAHVTQDRAFDPAHVGYLDAPDVFTQMLAPGSARTQRPDAGGILLDTQGAGPGLVAVSESFDPGWHAFLQGPIGERELAVHCLDAVILGVEVPAGACKVTLRYESPAWRLGLAVTTGALVLCLLWGVGLLRTRRGRVKA